MIGVFDSGVGGLSVVKEIKKVLPQYKIIYFGDTARLPYGTKGIDFVRKYSEKIAGWLLEKGVKIIVVACHTSSAQAGDYLKKKFENVPVFDMITPCVKELSRIDINNLGIIGTPGTIKSKAWEKHLLFNNSKLNISSRSCPLFVPLVEEGWIEKEVTKEVIKEYLKDFKNIDALILACTHYPMLESAIKQTTDAEIIDPAKILAKELKIFVNNSKIKLMKGKDEFYFSDEPYNLDRISELCLKQTIKPIISDPF